MEKFEVILNESEGQIGEKATGLKVSIDFDNESVNISGEHTIITASGREIKTPLSHSQFNNNVKDLNFLKINPDSNLTQGEKDKIQTWIDLTIEFQESLKPLLQTYMAGIYDLNNN